MTKTDVPTLSMARITICLYFKEIHYTNEHTKVQNILAGVGVKNAIINIIICSHITDRK